MFALFWTRRQLPGVGAMIALAIATFICTFGFFLETHGSTLKWQLLFNNIGYIGSMAIPVAWFVFAMQYTSGSKYLSRGRILLLCIVPVITIALVWSNNWHHLMWSDEHLVTSGAFIVTAKTYGPFFWVAITYSYILVIIAAIVLIRRLFVGLSLYVGQAISLIIAVVLPTTWSIISIFKVISLPRVELTPVMFALSGLAIAIGLFRFKLFTVVPFARKFLLQQLRDCILVFDIRRHLLEANQAAFVTLGMNINSIGESIENFPALAPALVQISYGQYKRLELPLTVTGQSCFYELETIPMSDTHNQGVGWLLILRDITERKRAEEALVDSEGRYRQLAKELKQRNEQMTGFLHSITHELRTPLTAITASAELLISDETNSISPEQQKHLLNNINQSAWMMDSTVGDLLDLARIQIGRVELKLEPIVIREVMDNLTSQLSPLFENKQQTIEIGIPGKLPLVKGDRKRTKQVILNLLSNANKYSVKGGQIGVFARTQNNMVRIEVKDSAPLINETERANLFEPYYRGGSTEEQQRLPGLGLGLAISKSLVTLMGGEIGVVSEEGHGNTFYFTLPIWKNEGK
jgi:signal transduction histidine kinase